jgi:copper chaperone
MKTDITIKGMHCHSCEMLLTDVLSDIDGVDEAKVSIKEGRAEVKYDPAKTDEAKMRAAIEAEGYTTE